MTVSTWIPAEASILYSFGGLRYPQQQQWWQQQQQCELVFKSPPEVGLQRRAGLAASQGFKAHVNSPAWPRHRQSPFGSKCWAIYARDEKQASSAALLTAAQDTNSEMLILCFELVLFSHNTDGQKSEASSLQSGACCSFLFHPWEVLIYFCFMCCIYIFC